MADSSNSFLTDRLLRNTVFLACLAAYGLFRCMLWLFPQEVPALARHYLADLLALPVILSAAVLIQRYLILRDPGYRLNAWQVLFAVLYVSVLFELVFPMFYPRYTADAWDVVAYSAGGLVYWLCINPVPESSS